MVEFWEWVAEPAALEPAALGPAPLGPAALALPAIGPSSGKLIGDLIRFGVRLLRKDLQSSPNPQSMSVESESPISVRASSRSGIRVTVPIRDCCEFLVGQGSVRKIQMIGLTVQVAAVGPDQIVPSHPVSFGFSHLTLQDFHGVVPLVVTQKVRQSRLGFRDLESCLTDPIFDPFHGFQGIAGWFSILDEAL